MMDVKREKILKNLEAINKGLADTFLELKEINKNEQFDYVTNAKLSDLSISALGHAKAIENIVFQEEK